MTDHPSAAFYRVEGTLLARPTLAAAAYMAANAQGISKRIGRLSNVAAAAPFAFAGNLVTGSFGTRMLWAGLRGMSDDRVSVLAEEYYEEYVRDEVLDIGLELIRESRRRGQLVVLISDNIEPIIRPLADQLGADEVVCNHLEYKRGEATGRLADPVVGGGLAGQWANSFASERGLDLQNSCAYGAQASDGLLLSAIGQPCAVNPDRQLRRLATDHDWPILER